MKATRFMRKPFFVTGYQVTAENMHVLARWCEGHIIGIDTDSPFIRVPVIRPTNPKQAEAYINMWIVASLHHGRTSFKVYNETKLLREFIPLEDDDMRLDDLELGVDKIEEETRTTKPTTPRGSGTSRPVPPQRQARTVSFQAAF